MRKNITKKIMSSLIIGIAVFSLSEYNPRSVKAAPKANFKVSISSVKHSQNGIKIKWNKQKKIRAM